MSSDGTIVPDDENKYWRTTCSMHAITVEVFVNVCPADFFLTIPDLYVAFCTNDLYVHIWNMTVPLRTQYLFYVIIAMPIISI